MKTRYKIILISILTLILSLGMTLLVMADEPQPETLSVTEEISSTETVTEDAEDTVSIEEEIAGDTEEDIEDDTEEETEADTEEETEAAEGDSDEAEDSLDIADTDKEEINDGDDEEVVVAETEDLADDDVIDVDDNDPVDETVSDSEDEIVDDAGDEEVVDGDDEISVNISDRNRDLTYTVDSDSTVTISDLLIKFDEAASGSESFVICINGKEYPITVYSDGSYEGELPENFSIEDGSIIITGVDANLDITIKDHTAISAISYEPEIEVPYTPAVTFTENDETVYYADEDGVVEIYGLFHEFDEGASGSETFEFLINGQSYTFTLDSDGNVYGELPEGFSIEYGILRIEGLDENMDIVVVGHTAISAISYEPEFEDPSAFTELSFDTSDFDMIKGATYVLGDEFDPYIEDEAEITELIVYDEQPVVSDSAIVSVEAAKEIATTYLQETSVVAEDNSTAEAFIFPEDDTQDSKLAFITPDGESPVVAKVLGASSTPDSPVAIIVTIVVALGTAGFVLRKKFMHN